MNSTSDFELTVQEIDELKAFITVIDVTDDSLNPFAERSYVNFSEITDIRHKCFCNSLYYSHLNSDNSLIYWHKTDMLLTYYWHKTGIFSHSLLLALLTKTQMRLLNLVFYM